MKKRLSGVLNLSGPADRWNDAKTISIFLLGPAGPDDPTNFYSPRWCAPSPDGIGNKGSDYALRGFLPFV